MATLAKLAQRAQARYDAAKQERGLLDFDDLILHARDLLAQREDLRHAFAASISQLLIDEAQDTDATQLNLLLPALRDDAGKLDPKKLFLVGDAKQSIYRFRGAQVEGFTELCRSLGDDRQVNLDISFRTHAKGTAFVNDLFSQLLVDYAPTVSHRTDAPQTPSVEILLADAPPEEAIDSSDRAKQAQAQLTAQRIDEMVRHGERIVRDAKTGTYRPVQYGDIAILFSRMTPSLDYERQLQQRNIPYYVVSGMGLFQQQEVYDLLNALRAIDTPHDDIATIGLLRSPMVGLDDNALAHLAETHTPPYLPSLNPAQLSERLDPAQLAALVRIQRLLAELAGEKDAMGIDEILERLLAETGYEATLLAQPAGRRKVGNVRLLVEEARSATGQMTLAEFIELMGEQVLSSLRDEQAGVAGENDNVVRLMTIHKAKGLEFPVVVVPDLNAGPRSDKNPILIDPDWGLTTKLLPYVESSEEDAADAPLAYRLAKQHDREADRDETLRKYYVALTRHEDHLVLIGANWRTKKDEFKPAGSFLAQLDDIFDLRGLLEAGLSQFAYRDETQGEHQARLACLTPTPPAARAASPTTPSAIAASTSTQAAVAAVAAAAGRESSATPPLLQALPTEAARIPLAVTALNQFAQCPARYHWQHELRSPYPPDPTPREKPVAKSTSASPAVPAALLGTFLHVCLEKLDLASPSIDDDWLDGIAASLPLPASVSLPALREAARPMLTRFLQSDWPLRLASANQVHRELDFLLNVGQAQLTGQIDLLYQIGETWHVVDYKSDQLNSDHETQSQKKAAYELQLLIYAHAIHARTGCVPADATLLLLRSGETLTIDINETTLHDAQQKIARTAAALVDARNRGQFARCEKPHCPLCRNPALRHVGLAKTGD